MLCTLKRIAADPVSGTTQYQCLGFYCVQGYQTLILCNPGHCSRSQDISAQAFTV